MQRMSQKLFIYVQADNNDAPVEKNQRAYKLLIIKWLLLINTKDLNILSYSIKCQHYHYRKWALIRIELTLRKCDYNN